MSLRNFILTVIFFVLLFGCYQAWIYYNRVFSPNVDLADSSIVFYIESDATYQEIKSDLFNQEIIEDSLAFDWVAKRKNYPTLIKPGRYTILDGMSNNDLVNLLRSGAQEPIQLVIRSVRTKEELARVVSKGIEADSAEIMERLLDPAFCEGFGLTQSTIMTMFIPNTYEFYWNTDADEFAVRMAKEYKRFWTDDRKAKAGALKLSQSEVSILASIVQAEQGAHAEERPVVAGLYLNRIRKGMRLESDPTLIHALGDFTIRRVLNVHKSIDSPYNTYKNTGLPPGPILLPEITSIDAVLNAEKHNYLFMCAKEDFSGYHNFASSYRAHINNANRYQRELNRRRIYQ